MFVGLQVCVCVCAFVCIRNFKQRQLLDHTIWLCPHRPAPPARPAPSRIYCARHMERSCNILCFSYPPPSDRRPRRGGLFMPLVCICVCAALFSFGPRAWHNKSCQLPSADRVYRPLGRCRLKAHYGSNFINCGRKAKQQQAKAAEAAATMFTCQAAG